MKSDAERWEVAYRLATEAAIVAVADLARRTRERDMAHDCADSYAAQLRRCHGFAQGLLARMGTVTLAEFRDEMAALVEMLSEDA